MKTRHYFVAIIPILFTVIFLPYLRASTLREVLPAQTMQSSNSPTVPILQLGTISPAPLAIQTKSERCIAHDALPDSACTPGAIFATATKEQICTLGYTKTVRNVPQKERNAVFAEYGIASHQPGEYEVDHLISLELGGSNDIANLWPEAASPTPGFHQKDLVENQLHQQLCSGAMSLSQVQQVIATNWLSIYITIPNHQ